VIALLGSRAEGEMRQPTAGSVETGCPLRAVDHPAHLSFAADPGERLARGAARFRRISAASGAGRHDPLSTNDEGPDDMPAHIKSMLTQTQLTIPVADGRLQLGVWQGIFLFEHRASPYRRSLILTLIGE
jgi:Uncharacterised protein family UPF0047